MAGSEGQILSITHNTLTWMEIKFLYNFLIKKLEMYGEKFTIMTCNFISSA